MRCPTIHLMLHTRTNSADRIPRMIPRGLTDLEAVHHRTMMMTDPQLLVLHSGQLIGGAIAVAKGIANPEPVPNETPHHQTSGMQDEPSRTTKMLMNPSMRMTTAVTKNPHRAAHAGVEPEAEAKHQGPTTEPTGVATNDTLADTTADEMNSRVSPVD